MTGTCEKVSSIIHKSLLNTASIFKTFFAAVIRKDSKGWPEGGYQKENALTREEAIRGMTIWAARSNFEEKEKGSLEKGKLADFVILDIDLLKAEEGNLLKANVLKTYVGGEKVFDRESAIANRQ